MKGIYLFLIGALLSTGAFATKAQVRGAEAKVKEKKDSIDQAIIQKQGKVIKLSVAIDSLNKAGVKGNQVDSLVTQRKVVMGQIHELENATPAPENGEVQSNLLSIAMLIFGLVLISLLLIFKGNKQDKDYLHTYKLIGIMFIGTVSVFLIPAGFDNTQITPIVGLLGTLAGYLVGSSTQNNNTQKPTTQPTEATK